MKVIGLDTGTTTISGVLLDDGVVIDTCTLPNDAKTYTGAYALQDAERLLSLCRDILQRLHAGTADAIALTGQMHGIVYVDDAGIATPQTVAHQAPLSMGFFRQEDWSRLPFPSLWDLPNPGIESRSSALQTDSLMSELQGRLETHKVM